MHVLGGGGGVLAVLHTSHIWLGVCAPGKVTHDITLVLW